MSTTALDLDALKAHVGRKQAATDVLHPGPANLLRLALGRSEPELHDGDPLPPAWQALYFLPRVATAELRPDGSPRDTGVVPPMPLPRRMFAGERVRFLRPLRVGESVRRETVLADLSVKSGSTGTLVFATVSSRVLGDRKSTRLNSSHVKISYAVFCLKKKRRVSEQRTQRQQC